MSSIRENQGSDIKRKAGRPPKRYTGRKATKLKLEALQAQAQNEEVSDEIPSEAPAESTTEDDIQARAWIAKQSQVGLQQLFGRGFTGTKSDYLPQFLDTVRRDQGGWTYIDTVRTLDVTFWFDLQDNDYSSKGFLETPGVDILWVQPAYISPKGAHARRFLVHWKKSLPFISAIKELAISHRKPVLRWTYICSGTCSVVPDDARQRTPYHRGVLGDSGDEEDLGTSSSDDDYEDSSEEPTVLEETTLTRGEKCSGRVKLHLEILADNLNIVHIWQQNEHPKVTSQQGLTWSRGLHNEVGRALRLYGVGPFIIWKNVVKVYGFPDDIANTKPEGSSAFFPKTFPASRLPTYKQITNMLPAIKRRARLNKDPFIAVEMMTRRHPDKIYFYVDHDSSLPDSQSLFSCAIATDFSLETVILHGSEDGLGLDSSWRHKNENRAAVSFLIAVDRQGHLTPGAALISANVKARTVTQFLDETEKKVVLRANAIVKGGLNSILHADMQDKKDIMTLSKLIVKHGQWSIRKWMIDKSSSLLKGILTHEKMGLVLVCQFHIVQAMIRFDGGNGRVANAPRIPYRIKFEIVKAFRQAQRCRSKEEWPVFHEQFLQALKNIVMSSSLVEEPVRPEGDGEVYSDDDPEIQAENHESQSKRKPARPNRHVKSSMAFDMDSRKKLLEFLQAYFNNHWFNEEWLEHVTDIGLAPGDTRDGTFYTNNWCEASFQTFDKVFLNQTKNKRLDRLLAIIIGDFFPFYQSVTPRTRNIPFDILNSNFEAYKLWDENKVQHLRDRIYGVAELRNHTVQRYQVDLEKPICSSSCTDWHQTGKACLHIRAAQLYEANGPVGDWEDLELRNQRMLHTSVSKSKRAVQLRHDEFHENEAAYEVAKRLPMDAPLDRQLERMFNHLRLDPIYNRLPEPSARAASPHPRNKAKPRVRVVFPRLREKEGFRSGWSATPGRPGRIPPMAPYRSLQNKTKRLQFSLKRGKRAGVRIHPKSLFTIDNLRRAKPSMIKKLRGKLLKKPTNTISGPAPGDLGANIASPQSYVPTSPPPNGSHQPDAAFSQGAVSNDSSAGGGLTQEEVRMLQYSDDFARWSDPSYTFRIEEMDLWVEILNQIAKTTGKRQLYMIGVSGTYSERNMLNALNSELESEFGKRVRQDIVARKIDSVAFFELTNSIHHWTYWDYRILSSTSILCFAVNSLTAESHLKGVNQDLHLDIVHACHRLRYPKAKELPKLIVDENQTGLQEDGTSCGFWTAFFAIFCLLGPGHHIREIPANFRPTLSQVKFWMARLWSTYLTDEAGVRGRELISIHNALLPESIGFGLPLPDDIIAPRLPGRQRIVREHDFPLKQEYEQRYLDRLEDPDYTLKIGNEQVCHADLKRILDPTGTLPTLIIDLYLTLLLEDWRFDRGVKGLPLPWHIASPYLTAIMANNTPRKGRRYKPSDSLSGQRFWFPEVNVFDLENLFLPWRYMRGDIEHWFLIHVQPRKQLIRIYDSSCNRTQQYHRWSSQRVLAVLEFDYQERHNNVKLVLPQDWKKKLDRFLAENTIPGPNQTDLNSLGVSVIDSVEHLCKDAILPEEYSPAQTLASRRRIALRLSREDYMPMKEISFSPDPPPITQVAESDPVNSPSPSLDATEKPPANEEDEWIQFSKDLPYEKWQLWRGPSGLYWPGLIKQGEYDIERRICSITIPGEIIPGFPHNPTEDIILSKRAGAVADDIIHCDRASPTEIEPIRWPAFLEEDSVSMTIRDYSRGDKIDWDFDIAPAKRPLVHYLRSHLNDAAEALLQSSALFSELREDALETFNGNIGWTSVNNFYQRHADLLDAYDKSIIMHLATWDISEGFVTGSELTWNMGLGSSILAYMAMGWYLGVSAEEAYDLKMAGRLKLPTSLAQEAWRAIEEGLKQLDMTMTQWQELCKSHRVLDMSYLPPRLHISTGHDEWSEVSLNWRSESSDPPPNEANSEVINDLQTTRMEGMQPEIQCEHQMVTAPPIQPEVQLPTPPGTQAREEEHQPLKLIIKLKRPLQDILPRRSQRLKKK